MDEQFVEVLEQWKGQRVRIIHIDNLPQGATAKMLCAGVRGYNETLLGAKRDEGLGLISHELMSFKEFDRQDQILNPAADLVFITVSEEKLSNRSSGKEGLRAPCLSIMTAQRILNNHRNIRVFLVPIANLTSLTGIDVVAGLLVGISGFVDERSLVMEETLGEILNHRHKDRRYKSMLLIGQLPNRIRLIKQMIEEWNNDIEADPTLDLASWRASLALAQLDKLEPIFGSAQPFSFKALADALNLARSVTFFRHTPDDLRRVLSTLARRWMGENHEPKDRIRLPEYARSSGFPRNPPAILGLDDDKVSRRTYNTLQSIEIICRDDLFGMQRCLVRSR